MAPLRRDEIRDYFRSVGLPEPYDETARRKILPEALEQRILAAFLPVDPGYPAARIGDRVAGDIAWSYPSPVPENPRIAGLICFRNERVDLTVDGQRLERPVTPWS